ncbi:MAG: cysteine peptidase family C39 domain-containing protein, partial [Candidatus Peregrinibacteria bacterium]
KISHYTSMSQSMNHRELPYPYQQDEASCGPATLALAARHYGIPEWDEAYFRGQLQVSEHQGTSNAELARVAQEHFVCTEKHPATPSELVLAIQAGRTAIVNFLIRGKPYQPQRGVYVPLTNEELQAKENLEGHFALVKGRANAHLIMDDPSLHLGPDLNMPLAELKRRWRARYEEYRQWMLVLEGRRALSAV